ncbi:MAG: hypothetical protein NDJ90_14740 [Oligoflexia bacterium]|nr:hypothetical protein [Oligoflexia bacterium]
MGTETRALQSVEEVREKILAGRNLVLAGDEMLLAQLPAGKWIGGTIPYFMVETGGACVQDRIFVTELPAFVAGIQVQRYDAESLHTVYLGAPENGFSVIIMPASSPAHFEFALKGPRFAKFASRPLIGWIAGVSLENVGKVEPKVFDGSALLSSTREAVVMRILLPPSKIAEIGILNIFEQSEGDTITFPEEGFTARRARVNGQEVNFADYLLEKKWDTRLPLVADYYGAMINTSIQQIDRTTHEVRFFAPVFKGVVYRHAKPVESYVERFAAQLPEDCQSIVFSCNCILNYLYSELEGKRTVGVTGPITFGEVAYQLLNQTMVYLTISDAK